jgi:multiple sugar transport system permease protein
LNRNSASSRAGKAMIAPILTGLALFAILPVIYLIGLSVTKSTLGNPMSEFLGLENFRRAVTGGEFGHGLWITTAFAFLVCSIQIVLGLALALLFDRITTGGGILRALILLPLMTPPVMVGIAWKLILAPSGGLLNGWLLSLGWIEQPISFFGSPSLAFLSIVVADTWQWTPFVALLCYSALKALPSDVYEASALDGAYAGRQFLSITLPMLMPALVAIFLIKLIIAFKTFDLVYILTFGGPGSSTGMSSFLIWRTTLRQFDVGLGASMTLLFAFAVTIITLPIVMYYARLGRKGQN